MYLRDKNRWFKEDHTQNEKPKGVKLFFRCVDFAVKISMFQTIFEFSSLQNCDDFDFYYKWKKETHKITLSALNVVFLTFNKRL